eukprot:1995472-Amphidinium_carterae.1
MPSALVGCLPLATQQRLNQRVDHLLLLQSSFVQAIEGVPAVPARVPAMPDGHRCLTKTSSRAQLHSYP